MHYNFVRQHQTTRITPAMTAGVTDKLLEITHIVKIVDDWERRSLRQRSGNEFGDDISYISLPSGANQLGSMRK
jgi:hypothetical protein